MGQAKLDSRLHHRLRELESRRERGEPDDRALAATRVGVWVYFSGDLEAAERAGLYVETAAGGVAGGTVALGDLQAVAEAEGVTGVRAVQEYRPMLDHSVPAIHADHASVVSVGGGSGQGVIVGVVDTGIDLLHRDFRKQDGTTRVLALLDLTLRQTISIAAGASAGTFQLKWEGPAKKKFKGPFPETTSLSYTATAEAIQNALLALRDANNNAVINATDVVVAGGPLPGTPVTIDFVGQYAKQEVMMLTAVTPSGTPPNQVVVTPGREFTEADINAFINNPSQGFPSVDIAGHGTHVAGIVAGNGSQVGTDGHGLCRGANTFVGVAPEADLVIVKRPFGPSDTGDTAVRGVEFIFTQATSRHAAAVVNLSFGANWGPHDGTTGEELLLNHKLLESNGIAATPGRAIVVSSGNDGARRSATNKFDGGFHARKPIPANGEVTIGFDVEAGYTEPVGVDVWYEGPALLEVTLTPPPGYNATGPVPPPASHEDTPLTLTAKQTGNPAAASGSITHWIDAPPTAWPGHEGHARHKNEIALHLEPTAQAATTPTVTKPAASQIAAGRWTITLKETAGIETSVDAWIPTSNKRIESGKQSRFAEADQDGTCTVSSPGSATHVITLGSYNYRDNTRAESSGCGPTLETSGFAARKPDLCAPGVQIASAKASAVNTGCWCDCCYDFYVDESGTSMAAPHVTGIVALMFGKNKSLTHEEIRSYLTSNAQPPDPNFASTLPDNEWGAGIVDAKEALAHVVAQASATPKLVSQRPAPTFSEGVVWTEYVLTPRRLAALTARAQSSPMGSLGAALVSTHFDEVKRLVNTNRRIVIVWQRMGGPELLRQAMRFADGRPLEIPANAWGRPHARRKAERTSLLEWLEQMLVLLHDYGSPALRADVARYRPLALELAATLLAHPHERRLAG